MTSGVDIELVQRARLEALARTGLLDAPAQPGLQRLADLAARVLDVPVVLVSLVDEHRQFFAAQAGGPDELKEARQTPLSHSFCQYVIEDEADLVIEDSREVARLDGNGAITDMNVIAYAGVPLATPDGIVYGSLCAIDHQPREWQESDLETLHALGEAVASEIEVRALLAEREEALATEVEFRTRLEAKRERLMMLARIGEIVDTIDDRRELAQAVAMELVPSLCDWCAVEVAAVENDEPIIVLGASSEHERQLVQELRELARATPQWRSPTIQAFEQHRMVYIADVDRAQLVDDGDLSVLPVRLTELLDTVGLASVSSMPLISHERVLGSISYVRRTPGLGFDELERENQTEVARRLAMAVESGRLREALEQRARAAEVIETIGDGVVLVEGDGRVSLWNPAAVRITGIDECTALGSQLDSLIPQLNEFVREGADNTLHATMLELQRGDGDSRWISASAVLVADSAVFALRDITDEHLLEQTRHELIATVSHQLRTPVASILAAGVTLQREDIVLPEGAKVQIIDTIVQQSQRLVELCGDVLLASRLDSGAHDVAAERVPLEPMLRELLRGVELHAGEHHRFDLELAVAEPVVVGDEHSLRQIFSNVLDNAVKYSPEGGAITVTVSASAGNVRVAFQDEGIGIPAGEVEHVFERFYRLDPQMRNGVTGSGLGLYVVRELARLMGGHVEVEQPGSGIGTRVTIIVPSA